MLLSFFSLYGDKGLAIRNLFTSSAHLLGESNIRGLIIRRVRFTVLCHLWFLLSITLIALNYDYTGIALLIVFFLILYPYSYFFHTHQRACQAWFAYARITNKAACREEVRETIATQKWRLRAFACAELLQSLFGHILSSSASDALRIWDNLFDVAESFLLPAITIDRLTRSQAFEKLKNLKTNLPPVLAGAWGLDIFGGGLGVLLCVVSPVILLLGGAVTYGLYHTLPQSVIAALRSNNGYPTHLALLPMLSAVVLISFIDSAIKIFITSLKATYFAVFYTTINKPEELPEETKSQIFNYLNLKT